MMLLRLTRTGRCDPGLGLDFSLVSVLREFLRQAPGGPARRTAPQVDFNVFPKQRKHVTAVSPEFTHAKNRPTVQ